MAVLTPPATEPAELPVKPEEPSSDREIEAMRAAIRGARDAQLWKERAEWLGKFLWLMVEPSAMSARDRAWLRGVLDSWGIEKYQAE